MGTGDDACEPHFPSTLYWTDRGPGECHKARETNGQSLLETKTQNCLYSQTDDSLCSLAYGIYKEASGIVNVNSARVLDTRSTRKNELYLYIPASET